MAVQQRARGDRRARRIEPPLRGRAGDEFLEGQRMGGERPRRRAAQERRDLVAKAEQAARLEPHHIHAAPHIGGKRRDRALGLRPRFLDQPDRQKSAAAAERTGAGQRLWQVHPVAGRAQDPHGGRNVLGLEIAVEGIGEQHHVALPHHRLPARLPRRAPDPGTHPCASAAACAAPQTR